MLGRYKLIVAPVVRRELSRWHQQADAIPDDGLRTKAVDKLRAERLNIEAAATYACLAALRHMKTAARMIVRFELIYNYLDALSEERVEDVGRNGVQLHRVLLSAIGQSPDVDYYRYHNAWDDGGFLERRAAACREELVRLPAAAALGPVMARAVLRCGEAQARSHAAIESGPEQLSRWSRPRSPRGFEWWEYAAGAPASLVVHALVAAASHRATTRSDAERIDAAYCPAIGAVATLLDSAVDYKHDREEGAHRFVDYYDDREAAAAGIAAITREAISQAGSLPNAADHQLIVAGIACFYLSMPGATEFFARPTTKRVLAEIGPIAGLITPVIDRRRRQSLVQASGLTPTFDEPRSLSARVALSSRHQRGRRSRTTRG